MRDRLVNRRQMLLAGCAVPAAALTSCAGIGGSGNSEAKPPARVSTKNPDQDVDLELLYVDDPPTKSLAAGLHKSNPRITLHAKETPFEDYIKSIKRTMASDSPADIAQYNIGAMRSLIPAGKILNLDKYSDVYRWDDVFPSFSLDTLRSDRHGETFNTGSLYAVPAALSIVGVFCNKSLLKKAKVHTKPQTVTEFESSMEKLKKSGITPLSVGGLETNGVHLWCSLVNVLGDLDQYRAWAYGERRASITGSDFIRATKTMSRWMRHGYIAAGANATSDSDALANFVHGKTAYHITGNWAAAEVQQSMGNDVGFFLVPGRSQRQKPVAAGSSVAYSISSKSKHPDVAARFLNYLRTPDAAQRQYEAGFMPVNAKAHIKKRSHDVLSKISTAFGDVVKGSGIVPFPDVATSGMLDKLQSGVQGVLDGRTASKEFLESLQQEWSEHHD